MTTRIVCKDGLTYVGDLDRRRSSEYRVFLMGHQHFIWKSAIQDMFVFRKRWRRIIGYISDYDAYIASGGDMWPAAFYNSTRVNDI